VLQPLCFFSGELCHVEFTLPTTAPRTAPRRLECSAKEHNGEKLGGKLDSQPTTMVKSFSLTINMSLFFGGDCQAAPNFEIQVMAIGYICIVHVFVYYDIVSF